MVSNEKLQFCYRNIDINKDENVHRFVLSVRRGELLERERERETAGESNKNIKCYIKGGQKVWPKVNCLISRDLLNANLKIYMIVHQKLFRIWGAPISFSPLYYYKMNACLQKHTTVIKQYGPTEMKKKKERKGFLLIKIYPYWIFHHTVIETRFEVLKFTEH